MWHDQLSQSEKDEMYLDACEAFNIEVISEKEFRETLVQLGYNATDIEEIVKDQRPCDTTP
jgi:Holliday junction resolvasome RuvABC DNA-binding subunit